MTGNMDVINGLEVIAANYSRIAELKEQLDTIDASYNQKKQEELIGSVNDIIKVIDDYESNLHLIVPKTEAERQLCEASQAFETYEDVMEWITGQQYSEDDKGKERFLQECLDYDSQIKDMVEKSLEYRDRQLEECTVKRTKIDEERDLEKQPLLSEIQEKIDECNALDLLHQDHWVLAGDVAQMLKTRRAGSLTDALNLVIKNNEEKRFREEMLAKQTEEADVRNRILQDQADAERAHNEALEKMEREKAYNLQRQLQRQTELMERQAEEAQRQTEEMRRQTAAAEKSRMAEEEARRKAENAESRRQHDLAILKRAHDTAALHYRSAVAGGRTEDATRWETELRKIEAEMRSL